MTQYLILFNSDQDAQKIIGSASPDEIKASMQLWMDWKNEADKTISFEWGLPMKAVAHITSAEVSDGVNQATGHAFIESDNQEKVTTVLKSHPHLRHQVTSIDLIELIPMAGM